jgi:hypothetical protein
VQFPCACAKEPRYFPDRGIGRSTDCELTRAARPAPGKIARCYWCQPAAASSQPLSCYSHARPPAPRPAETLLASRGGKRAQKTPNTTKAETGDPGTPSSETRRLCVIISGFLGYGNNFLGYFSGDPGNQWSVGTHRARAHHTLFGLPSLSLSLSLSPPFSSLIPHYFSFFSEAAATLAAALFGLFLGSSLRSVTHFGGRGGGGHCHRVESVGIAPALLRCVLAHPTHHRPHLLELGQEQLRVLQVATGAACDAHL